MSSHGYGEEEDRPPSQRPRDVYDFRDYLRGPAGPPQQVHHFGTPPKTHGCPTCHRPMWEYKWYWYYEANGPRWKAILFRILNR